MKISLKRKRREEKAREAKGVHYRYLLVISVFLVALSVGILVNGYMQKGDWFLKSIELKGGTVVSVSPGSPVSVPELEKKLSERFGQVSIRETTGLRGYGISVEVDSSVNATDVLGALQESGISTEKSSIATVDPAIGETFWYQAQVAVILAFVFMAITIFIIFRTFVPSTAVILAAGCDIIETLAFMQIFGIEMSLASLAALLMLIGYSVDTDIILTTRVLKVTERHVDERIKSAMKTGIMTVSTTTGALAVLYLSAISPVLSQIAAVLLIGLVFDVANTWIQNAAIIRWYAVRKGI